MSNEECRMENEEPRPLFILHSSFFIRNSSFKLPVTRVAAPPCAPCPYAAMPLCRYARPVLRTAVLKIWLFVVAVALFINIGGYPLFDADEGRNGEVGREMAATNDYVMPRIDGMPYLDKPIVYFAAEAAAMEVLGPTELAARLPAYLFTLLTALLVFWFAKKVWNEESAYIAAIAFL